MDRWARAVVVLGALLLLAAAAPAMRGSWVSLTNFHSISRDGVYSLGTLTVTSCTHEPLPHDWTCRGDYRVTDPLGDPGHDRLDIPLANDFRRHAPGDQIDVATISRRESAAYLSGTDELVRVGAFWLGVLAAVAAIGLVLVSRRRIQLVGAAVAIAAGLLLSPTLVRVW